MKMFTQILGFNFSENFALGGPLIRFSLNPIGSFIIKTLVVRLEDATMPKTVVGFHSSPHLFLILLLILFLKMLLEVLVNLSRNNK